MIVVVVPRGLRSLCGTDRVEVQATSVRGVLAKLKERFPGFAEGLGDSYAVSIDGEVFHDALYEPVAAESEIHFLPALSGG